MKVYAVIGYTARIDWASRSEKVILGYYKLRKSAAGFITEMKKTSSWHMHWEVFDIETIEVKE